MKLVIQIPCYNEADTLPVTIAELPKQIDGIDTIVLLIIDDGSKDDTVAIAQTCGADIVICHRSNRGLAAAFQTGIDAALRLGADIIVNTDGDNQYSGEDIPKLVAPIVKGDADIVIGDRQLDAIDELSRSRKWLQRWGSRIVRWISGVNVPDAVSGFRAISADAATKLNIVSKFSYTTEMLIHAGFHGLAVQSVPVHTNRKLRESRLYRTVPEFIRRTGVTILRSYTMYRPLRVFGSIGLVFALIGAAPIFRFLAFYFSGAGEGKIQSLVIGGSLVSLGAISILLGICAEVIATNRRIQERTLARIVELERLVLRSQSGNAESQSNSAAERELSHRGPLADD